MLKVDGPHGADVEVSQTNAALTLDRLTYIATNSGNAVPLVSDISLAVQSSEIVAIVGPNGAGKTTLVRMIAGLLAPTAGEIRLKGQALNSLSHAERARHIAYVGQSEEPDGRLLVNQYVSLGSLPYHRFLAATSPSDRTTQALNAVGLEALAKRRMSQLSGGERQKAKIARALCQEPSLIILDEPTNHLDPFARGELLSLIASMGICVIAALHDLTLIDAFADKVAVISQSHLAAFGTPQDVLTNDRMLDVFRVDMHRFDHPTEPRSVPALDITVDRAMR